jgi:hypothetical protein
MAGHRQKGWNRAMKCRFTSAIALVLTSASALSGEVHGYQVPGTYQLSICKSGCSPTDSRRAFSTVVVVLSMRPLADGEPRPPGEGCFAVTNLRKTGSYVQLETLGKTQWTIEDGKLKFALFHSPDARYDVELEMDGYEVRGAGRSRGAGLAYPGHLKDQVVGYRMTPPDMAACKPWKPVPIEQLKFIPYSPLDDAQARSLEEQLERAGLRDVKAADLTRDVYSHHTFHDADVFKAFPQLRGYQKLSECSNRMMTNATNLVFLVSKGANEATLETIRCHGAADGIRCPEPERGHYYFLDGTDQYFTLDGLTFATAKAIMEAFSAGRITGLPEFVNPKAKNVTAIKSLFDNRYEMIIGEFFCSGCATRFDVDFETENGEGRLNVVGQPEGGCY